MPSQRDDFVGELAWLRGFTPATRSAARDLPSLQGERLLVVCHLDLRMVPYFEARLAAAHLGFPTPTLEECLPRADVLFTATGRDGVVPFETLSSCRDGAFLANLGHTAGELPVRELRQHVIDEPRPHVERCEVGGKTLFLLAGGAMFNLAAGPGDPYDTFDLVTALMLEATGFLATEGVGYPPGIHPLPREVQDRAARRYLERPEA